jgi:hypothetical protein
VTVANANFSPYSRRWLWHPSTTSRTLQTPSYTLELEYADLQHDAMSSKADDMIDPHSTQAIGRIWQQAHDSASG